MKVYIIYDNDGGNKTIIVAENIKTAIDIWFEKYKYYPERVHDLTADGEIVLIESELEEK